MITAHLRTFWATLVIALIAAPCFARSSSETMAAIREATEGNLPAVERVAACIRLLEIEMADPSKASFGVGGGPIDSGYLQGVIMGSVCTFAQKGEQRDKIRSILAVRLAAVPQSAQAMRDRLTIMLGYTGDQSALPQLISILDKHPKGFMRAAAVLALREIEDCSSAVLALQRAVASDTYARVRFGEKERYDSVTMVYSPVRQIAAEVLKKQGFSVPSDVEVVAPKYAVDRLAPLLYDGTNPECAGAAIETLETIGGTEAKTALQVFINKQNGNPHMQDLVKQARAALGRLRAKQQTHGPPSKLSSLTDLGIVRRKDFTPVQKTDVLLAWLTEERKHPTPTHRGLGGGDINSSYIQAQIVKALAEAGDPLTLRKVASDSAADPIIRDAARLALAYMGDVTQTPYLISVLEYHSEPYFRKIAAAALGGLGATAAIPALKRALQDNYTALGARKGGVSTVYPVREAAQVALRVLNAKDPELQRFRRQRIASFQKRLAASRKASQH